MNELTVESVVICAKQQLIDSAAQTLIDLCSCSAPGLVGWVSTSLLQTLVSSLTLTGTLRMTFRYKQISLCYIFLSHSLSLSSVELQ